MRIAKGKFDFIQNDREILIAFPKYDSIVACYLSLSKGKMFDFAGFFNFSQKGRLKIWFV